MFNIGSINNSRFNGVLSHCGKKTSNRKDRKGCKKEKIDSILKDKMVSACRLPVKVNEKKAGKQLYNSRLKATRKSETSEPGDSYFFVDHEPQVKRFSKTLLSDESSNGKLTYSSYNLGNVSSKQSLKSSDSDSNHTNKPNDANKWNASKPSADISFNRSNSIFNLPENKPKTSSTSVFGDSTNVPSTCKVVLRPKRRNKLNNWKKDDGVKHEALQRIHNLLEQNVSLQSDLFPLELSSSDDEEDVTCDDNNANIVERCMLPFFPSMSRESRLSQVKVETCKKLQQMLLKINSSNDSSNAVISSIINVAKTYPSQTALLLNPQYNAESKKNRSKDSLMVKRICSLDLCDSKALPGARYCFKHILYNVDQQLFSHCAGKMSDNTQCHMPVFDVKQTSPLCLNHSKQEQDKSPPSNNLHVKKNKKKSKSLLSRHGGKKRKKSLYSHVNSSVSSVSPASPASPTSTCDAAQTFLSPPSITTVAPSAMILRRGEEVFLTDASVPVNSSELETAVNSHCELVQLEEVSEEVLASSRLLDDHEDLTTVLNQLPADAFNDLFSDKNGQYEPTREETEELERALEAVDKDVRVLERMTRTHIGIFDSVHAPTLPEDINAQLYTGYSNGFTSSPVSVPLASSNLQKL